MADIPAPPAGAGGKGAVLDPMKQMLFSICFFYAIYWMWLRIGELNGFLGKEAIKPLFFFIGIICGPVMLYVMWLMVNAVHEAQLKVDPQAKDDKIMDLVFLLICAPFGIFKMQQKLNAIWQK